MEGNVRLGLVPRRFDGDVPVRVAVVLNEVVDASRGAADVNRDAVLEEEPGQRGELRVEHPGGDQPRQRRDDLGRGHGPLRG